MIAAVVVVAVGTVLWSGGRRMTFLRGLVCGGAMWCEKGTRQIQIRSEKWKARVEDSHKVRYKITTQKVPKR